MAASCEIHVRATEQCVRMFRDRFVRWLRFLEPWNLEIRLMNCGVVSGVLKLV